MHRVTIRYVPNRCRKLETWASFVCNLICAASGALLAVALLVGYRWPDLQGISWAAGAIVVATCATKPSHRL